MSSPKEVFVENFGFEPSSKDALECILALEQRIVTSHLNLVDKRLVEAEGKLKQALKISHENADQAKMHQAHVLAVPLAAELKRILSLRNILAASAKEMGFTVSEQAKTNWGLD